MVTTASGKTNMRSFTVVEAKRVDGCPTKFAVKGHGGRFIKRTPRAAASTAFNRLCRRKRIKGQCAMILSVQETTQGSAGEVFTYKLNRNKLAEPIQRGDYLIQYDTEIASTKHARVPASCTSGKQKSSGPIMHSAKSPSPYSKRAGSHHASASKRTKKASAGRR